jgi:hypothetical protein
METTTEAHDWTQWHETTLNRDSHYQSYSNCRLGGYEATTKLDGIYNSITSKDAV